MTDLTNIFPTNYPNRPLQGDIEILFQDILNRSDSVDAVVCAIEDEPCPYYREALTHCLADKLDDWYKRRSGIAGIDYGNYWIPYWQDPKDKIQQLLSKYENEQHHTRYEPIEPQPCLTNELAIQPEKPGAEMPSDSKVANQLKNAIMQVVQDLSAMQLSVPATHITIQNMPVTIHINSPGIKIDKNTADITSYEQSTIYNR